MFAEILTDLSRYIYPILFIVMIILAISSYNQRTEKRITLFLQQILILIFTTVSFIILLLLAKSNEEEQVLKKIMITYIPFLVVYFTILQILSKKIQVGIFNLMLLLTSVGIIILVRLDNELALKQIQWVLLSTIALFILIQLFKIPVPFSSLALLYGMLGFGLLVLPFIYGKTIYGATNWVMIKGISFQPSEFVKILLIFMLASLYTKKRSFKYFLIGGGMSALYILILVLQRDLGGALIYLLIYIIMTYVYVRRDSFLLLGLLGCSLGAYISYKLFYHVRVRVEAWIYPWENITTSGYQIAQSLFAIAEGGWFGTGLTLGRPEYIPIVTSDFIFSALCEEFGIIVGICIIIMYYMLFLYIIRVINEESIFYSYLIIGFGTLLSFQVFLIIGGVLKLIPLTGVTLPFISYGGSSFLSYSIVVAIIQSIIMNNKRVICESE